jgi:transcriptional regulator GlxA family with amidase domain
VDGRIYQLSTQIAQDLGKAWTVDTMAETTGLSSPHFQRLFRLNIGSGPMAYLHDLRLEKSKFLLETTFLRIKQIRIHIGLTSDSHLAHAFKEKFGVTATEYRRHHWQTIQNAEAKSKKR